MNTGNPNKYIRKEIYDRIHNADIGGIIFKCFDSRVTSEDIKTYFLISTQLNQPSRTKCNRGWINSTEIQVIVRTFKNTGSRVLIDDAVDEVLTELDEFSLPVGTGLHVSISELSVDNEFVQDVGGEIIYTKIMRLETTIN